MVEYGKSVRIRLDSFPESDLKGKGCLRNACIPNYNAIYAVYVSIYLYAQRASTKLLPKHSRAVQNHFLASNASAIFSINASILFCLSSISSIRLSSPPLSFSPALICAAV